MAPRRIARTPPSLRKAPAIRTPRDKTWKLAQRFGDDALEKRMKEGAEVIAEEVKTVASKRSRRIPSSVKVTGNLGAGFYIEAGGPGAPNAYPFDPVNPPVRHPVWGHGPRDKWHWASMPYFPFMEEGAEKGADKAAEAVAEVLDDWAKENGFNK